MENKNTIENAKVFVAAKGHSTMGLFRAIDVMGLMVEWGDVLDKEKPEIIEKPIEVPTQKVTTEADIEEQQRTILKAYREGFAAVFELVKSANETMQKFPSKAK